MLELFNEGVGGLDRVKREIVRGEEMLTLAPTRIGLKNLWMTEARTVIGKHACDRSRARPRSEALYQRIIDQTEFARSHNLTAGLLPNLNNQLLFCDFVPLYFFSICLINRSA